MEPLETEYWKLVDGKLIPLDNVAKHGNHDQSTHGHRGFQNDYVLESGGGTNIYRSASTNSTIEFSRDISKAKREEVVALVSEMQDVAPIDDVQVTCLSWQWGKPDVDARLGVTIMGAGPKKIALNVNSMFRKAGRKEVEAHKEVPLQRYVVTHEWGHAIDAAHTEDFSRVPAWSSIFVDAGKAVDHFGMTKYGMTNDSEFYAEAFADWHLSGGSGMWEASSKLAASEDWAGLHSRVSKVAGKVEAVRIEETFVDAPKVFHLIDGEWVEVATDLAKHGNHDQSSHGRRGGGASGQPISAKEAEVRSRMSDIRITTQEADSIGATASYVDQDGNRYHLMYHASRGSDGNGERPTRADLVDLWTPDWEKGGWRGTVEAIYDYRHTVAKLDLQELRIGYDGNKANMTLGAPEGKLTIHQAATASGYRRKGLATALLALARDVSPMPVIHSTALLDDGVAWSSVVKHGNHDQSTHGHRGSATFDVKATASALEAGKSATITPAQLKPTLDALADATELADLSNLHIEGVKLFDGENLGLDRSEMPQVPSGLKQEFLDEMSSRGIKVTRTEVDPFDLKPIQNEISGKAAGGIMRRESGGWDTSDKSRLVISRDGYVLDGHHRWAAATGLRSGNPSFKLPVLQMDVDVKDAIATVKDWNAKHGIHSIDLGQRNSDTTYHKALVVYLPFRLLPALKHLQGQHDQSTHGQRGVSAGLTAEIQQKVLANGGLTVSLVDGSEPLTGYTVSVNSKKWGVVENSADFHDPVKGKKILSNYMKSRREQLAEGAMFEGNKPYLGLWEHEGKVYLDVSVNTPSKELALNLGKIHDQIGIWDVVNQEEIMTGGTGSVGKRIESVGSANESRRDERRGNRPVGGQSMGDAGQQVVVEIKRYV